MMTMVMGTIMCQALSFSLPNNPEYVVIAIVLAQVVRAGVGN